MKSIYLLLILLMTFSCSNNDDNDIENSIDYNGVSYAITNGAVIDLGPSQNTTGFSKYAILLANDDLDIIFFSDGLGNYSTNTNNSTISFKINIHTPQEGDITGTFPFRISGTNATSGYNMGVFLSVDINLDGDFIDENDLVNYIDQGTLSISGSAPNYTISLISQFPDESPLSFTYRGSLETYEIP